MSLDTTEPKDSRQVNELPGFIRANRSAINAFSVGSGFAKTDLTVAPGTTSLSVGVDLEDAGVESIIVEGGGASVLETILGATDGQVKILVFTDSLVDLLDGNDKADGKFYLNHLPAATNFEPEADDVIALMNVGGDPGVDNGWWEELFRKISVK